MFGRGTIATMYGWALQEAGHEVDFYVRPGRADEYGARITIDLFDLRTRPWGERVVRTWSPRYIDVLEPDHGFDLIVVSVAHYRLAEAAAFLAPRLGDATVLVFGNVWAEPDAVIGDLPAAQVVWGFPQAGGGIGVDGVIRGTLLGSVVFGTVDEPSTTRGRGAREAFGEAGFRIKEQPDFRGWLWLHFISDAAMHSQGLRLGSLADLIGRTGDLRQVQLATREMLPLLEARGIDLRRHRAGTLPFRIPAWITAGVLATMLAHFRPLRANFEAHSDTGAEEPRVICRDTLAESRRLGISVSRLEAAEPFFAD